MDKSYFTLSLTQLGPNELDILSYELFELGAEGVSEPFEKVGTTNPPQLIAYFRSSPAPAEIENLKSRYPKVKIQLVQEADQDWMAEWKKTFRSFELTPGFWIVPSWEKDRGDIQGEKIWMDPGMAFGTGTHETTQMASQLIAEVVKPQSTVLDVGTGTGVLAMIAEKRGAKSIIANDNDPEAVRVAKENAVINNCQKIEITLTDVAEISGSFDCVVANIISSVLVGMKKHLLAKTKTHLIMTGVLAIEAEEFIGAFAGELKLVKQLNKGEWAAFLFEKLV